MAGLSSTEKHAIWKAWNEEISRQRIQTGADKWDVLVAVWHIDEELDQQEDDRVRAGVELAETLDGKSALEAKQRGAQIVEEAVFDMTTLVPRASSGQIGDDAHQLLVGLVQQRRDEVFRPLPQPEVDEPIGDIIDAPIGDEVGKK